MDWIKVFYHFEFYNDFALNNQVQAQPISDFCPFIRQLQVNLTLMFNSLQFKFPGKALFINAFDQSRTPLFMNGYSRPDDLFSQVFLWIVHFPFSSVPPCALWLKFYMV